MSHIDGLIMKRQVLPLPRTGGCAPACELAGETGLRDRQIKRILARLADQGFIKREGSTRYGKWVILDTGGGSHAARVGD